MEQDSEPQEGGTPPSDPGSDPEVSEGEESGSGTAEQSQELEEGSEESGELEEEEGSHLDIEEVLETSSMEIANTATFKPSRGRGTHMASIDGEDVKSLTGSLRSAKNVGLRLVDDSGYESAMSKADKAFFDPELARSVVVDMPYGHTSSKMKLAGSDSSTLRKTISITGQESEASANFCPVLASSLLVDTPISKDHTATSQIKQGLLARGSPRCSQMELDEYAEQAKDVVDNVISSAKVMVDDVIASAFRRLETRMSEREKTCESLKAGQMSREDTLISRDENYEPKDIGWMTIEQFSLDLAEQRIHEYIKTWEYENSWLYCVDFLGEDVHKYDKRYRFRVRWSIPTRRKPVPRATASVYFTFVVSTIKPKNYPVDVFYVFETNRLVHKPGQSRFREKWLKDIIESKVSMMAAIRF